MKFIFTADRRITGEFVVDLSAETPVMVTDDSDGNTVYLTFRKEEYIEIDYNGRNEYDVEFTNEHISGLNLFDAIDALEKTLVLEINIEMQMY